VPLYFVTILQLFKVRPVAAIGAEATPEAGTGTRP